MIMIFFYKHIIHQDLWQQDKITNVTLVNEHERSQIHKNNFYYFTQMCFCLATIKIIQSIESCQCTVLKSWTFAQDLW